MREPLPPMEQHPAEFGALLDLLERERVRSILEIGVFQGGTLERFASRFPQVTVVGIDARPIPGLRLSAPVVGGASQDPGVRQRARSLNDGEPFDFVFIDGDHTYPAARLDWEWAQQEVTRLVAFHDIASEGNLSIDTRRLWLEITSDSYIFEKWTEITLDDRRNGIGVIWL